MSPAISLRCLFMELVRLRTCCIWGFDACDSLMHVLLVCFHICFCSSEMSKFVIHCSVQDCEPCPHIAALALCLHVLASLVAFLACHFFVACFSLVLLAFVHHAVCFDHQLVYCHVRPHVFTAFVWLHWGVFSILASRYSAFMLVSLHVFADVDLTFMYRGFFFWLSVVTPTSGTFFPWGAQRLPQFVRAL